MKYWLMAVSSAVSTSFSSSMMAASPCMPGHPRRRVRDRPASSRGEADPAPSRDPDRSGPLVLLEQRVDRGVAAVAARAGEAALSDLVDRRRAVLDLAADPALVDAVTQTDECHRRRKVVLTDPWC